jgi:hypothetical protein
MSQSLRHVLIIEQVPKTPILKIILKYLFKLSMMYVSQALMPIGYLLKAL